MHELKIVYFLLFFMVYMLYNINNMWSMYSQQSDKKTNEESKRPSEVIAVPKKVSISAPEIVLKEDRHDNKIKKKLHNQSKFSKNACTITQIFTDLPIKTKKINKKIDDADSDTNTLTMIGITIFLVILALNAILDVMKVKEEERARRKLNPDGIRRQSLAEFANKKPLRRESSKFSLQLFQIAESFVNNNEEKKPRRQVKNYTRGDSTNSYLSEKKAQSEGSAPGSVNDSTSIPEAKLPKRQSAGKLFGARPARMVRRSSFPALPLNPDVQALMLGHRQTSVDSDDEGDGRGRRVRLIRRF